jgi:hypothetical protein
MEARNLKAPPPLAARILKLVGLLLVLSFVIDFLVLLVIAPQFENLQWQLNFVNQVVDRGIIPLIGFALLYAGYWIETIAVGASGASGAPGSQAEKSPWQDWRFWAFVFASLLGLLFLIAIPFHLNVTEQLANQAIDQVNQQAAQAEVRIEQEQRQLKAIVNSGQLDQLLKSNQVPEQQKVVLRQAQQDPQALDRQAAQLRDQVRNGQTQALNQSRNEALLSRIRVASRALLLMVGFAMIGWNGLRESR